MAGIGLRGAGLAAAAALLSGCATIPEPVDRPGASDAAHAFLAAFNSLDRTAFDAHFAHDVTMFFPDGPFPVERLEGKAAVLGAFHRFFDMAKARGATKLSITPSDLKVQTYGETAIVSFELAGDGAIGRRSLVLRHSAEGWKIVHFHASRRERAAQ